MIYIFDSCTLIHLFNNYYPSRFPSLWKMFAEYIEDGRITSVSEVFREVTRIDDAVCEWARRHPNTFSKPATEELQVVSEIFQVQHFQQLVRKQEQLSGHPVADPFVIAKAKVVGGCVVTEELHKPNAAKIPNICAHFKVDCLQLEGFMERENWIF